MNSTRGFHTARPIIFRKQRRRSRVALLRSLVPKSCNFDAELRSFQPKRDHIARQLSTRGLRDCGSGCCVKFLSGAPRSQGTRLVWMELANAWSASSVLFREARVSSRVRLAPIVEAIVRFGLDRF